jgi:hypothetical protein
MKYAQKLSASQQQLVNGGWATDTFSKACVEGPSNPFYYKCFCGIDG